MVAANTTAKQKKTKFIKLSDVMKVEKANSATGRRKESAARVWIAPGSGKIGAILVTAEQIVGVGESVYTLVQKGKPSINLEAAPISVLPLGLDKNNASPSDFILKFV